MQQAVLSLSQLIAIYFSAAKDCGILSVPLNGSLSGNETTFPNKITFSCDEGFILNGSSVRRCLSDGSWSGIQTSCKGELHLMFSYEWLLPKFSKPHESDILLSQSVK